MGLKEYDVEINGHTTTLQLSDEDAKNMGLTGHAKEAKAPANKEAKTPANKSAAADKRAEAVSRAMNKPKTGDA